MHKNATILAILIVILMSWICAASGGEYTSILSDGSINPASLAKLMANGQLLIVKETNGKFKYITSAIIINKPVEEVYKVITDYANYYKFMPSCEEAKVVKEQDNVKDIFFHIRFTFAKILSWNARYTLHTEHFPNKGTRWTLLKDDPTIKNDISDTWGAWELFGLSDGSTAAFYTVYSDIKSLNWAVKVALSQDPSLEVALNASTCTMVLKAVKKRCEVPDYEPNLKK